MRGVRLSLAVIAAAALVAVAAGAGRASFPGTNGRLFFIASHHVYSIAEDGTGLAQVTSGSANDLAVASSPDGRRLVVERDTGDQCGHLFWRAGYELFLVNPDGSASVRLTDDCPKDEVSPAWSPSGNHLAYSSQGSIWVSRPDVTQQSRLTCTGGDDDFFPSWSPDGRLIAFDHIGDVDVMNVDGTGQRRLATGWLPSFSPDGTKIAYGGAGPDPGIHVVNVDGSGDVRLTTGPDGNPVWSPDGTEIAFVRRAAGGPGVLEKIRTDGTGLTTIVDQLDVGDVDWARSNGPSGAFEPDVTPEQTACPESAPPPPPPVAPGDGSGAVDASAVRPPDRMLVVAVAIRPLVLRSRRPFSISLAVGDTEGRRVRGALVRITPLTGGAKPTAQVATDAHGTAVVSVAPTRQLRLRKGGRLVLGVHVRRPGAPWAGDSSGLRLISVRTA